MKFSICREQQLYLFFPSISLVTTHLGHPRHLRGRFVNRRNPKCIWFPTTIYTMIERESEKQTAGGREKTKTQQKLLVPRMCWVTFSTHAHTHTHTAGSMTGCNCERDECCCRRRHFAWQGNRLWCRQRSCCCCCCHWRCQGKWQMAQLLLCCPQSEKGERFTNQTVDIIANHLTVPYSLSLCIRLFCCPFLVWYLILSDNAAMRCLQLFCSILKRNKQSARAFVSKLICIIAASIATTHNTRTQDNKKQ